MASKWCLVCLLALQLHHHGMVHACHTPQHEAMAATAPGGDFAASGRRRRQAASYGKDADPELSKFFTDCMLKKTGPIFQSWRSVIDFILRDTMWFEATDVEFCRGYRDTAKCWKRRLEFLLRVGSILLTPGQNCIGDYDVTIKAKRGKEWETFFVENYESHDYDISLGEFLQWKKIPPSGNLFNARRPSGKVATIVSTPSAKPTLPAEIEPYDVGLRDCPDFNLLRYNVCILRKLDELIEEDNILDSFPSLEYFELTSVEQFVQFHYSSCRITKEEMDGNTTYIENCHSSNTSEPNSVSDISPLPDCVILELPDIVKPNSPVHQPVVDCTNQEISLNGTELDWKRPDSKRRLGKCLETNHWTRWINSDNPEGLGDMETLEELRQRYRGQICENPIGVDARTVSSHKYHSSTGQMLYLSLEDGLRCFNSEQTDGNCEDYKIRFCCEYTEPKCDDGNQWTAWLNADNQFNGGDFESLSEHQSKSGVCETPTAIRAQVKRLKKHHWKGYDVLDISPETGLSCKNSEQKRKRCSNYEVSFCCPPQ